MKKLVIIAFIAASCFAVKAQTDTNNPVRTFWDFATTGSNYWVVPFSTYSISSHEFGGGVALGYHVSDVINPVFRLDYFASKTYTASMNVQLQVPRQFMGKIPFVPLAYGGVGTPFNGSGVNNGQPIEIVGVGAWIDMSNLGNGWFFQKVRPVASYEHWFGLPANQVNHINFGLGIKF